MPLSREGLHVYFKYNPYTGRLTWRQKNMNCKKTTKAGCKSTNGYIVVGLGGKVYTAHRLIWLYMTGEMPKQIDHIDGNKTNNRWNNLRNVTHQQNNYNKSKSKNKSSKYKGVCYIKRTGKWLAYIDHDSKRRYLGTSITEQEAAKLYNVYAQQLFGEYAKLNSI